MVPNEFTIGDTVSLKNSSRRRFLKQVGGFSAGYAALMKSIENATASSVDGVPIVHTVDRAGNPKRIRIVPRERRRKIRAYSDLPVRDIVSSNSSVESISLEQPSQDETDLVVVLHASGNMKSAREETPDQLNGLPTEIRDSTVQRVGEDWCSENVQTNEPLEGTIRVQTAWRW